MSLTVSEILGGRATGSTPPPSVLTDHEREAVRRIMAPGRRQEPPPEPVPAAAVTAPRKRPSKRPPATEYARECESCGLRFTARRRTAKTCSDKCRKELHERRHAPPSRLAAPGEDACAYCGAPATDREHVYPRAYIQRMQAEGKVIPQTIVPSCRECNQLAGDKVFRSKAAKARFIGSKIAERHAAILETPDWSTEEIAELGYALRTAVRTMLAQRDAVRARLAWNERTYPRLRKSTETA